MLLLIVSDEIADKVADACKAIRFHAGFKISLEKSGQIWLEIIDK